MQKKDEHFKTLYPKPLKINGYLPIQLKKTKSHRNEIICPIGPKQSWE